jgi:hypothetical protein
LGFPETKSAKEGPALRRSLKAVVGRGWLEVVVGGDGSVMAVASVRLNVRCVGMWNDVLASQTNRRADVPVKAMIFFPALH